MPATNTDNNQVTDGQVEQICTEREQPLSDRGFVPGYTLRFAPENVRIRLNPAKGWDFAGPSNAAPPPRRHPPVHLKIGMTIDGTPPKRSHNKKHGTPVEVYNPNEPVFICTIKKSPGTEVTDSLQNPIQDCFIRWDPEFSTLEARLLGASHLQDGLAKARAAEMRDWRISQRNWEADLLTREFSKGNLAIFPPDITEDRINASIAALEHDNQLDREGHFPTEFIGRPRPLVTRQSKCK